MVALGLAFVLGLLAGVRPGIALVGAGVLAFVMVLLASFSLAAGIFITVTFINLPDNAAKAIGALLALAVLARIATSGARDLSFASAHPVATANAALFLAWCLVGLSWARDPSALTTAVMRYALNVVLLFVVYAAVRTRRDLLMLIGLFLLGCAVAATYGLVHPPAASQYGDLARSGGTLGDPNELAAVLVVGLLLSAAFAVMRSLATPVPIAAISAGILCLAGIAFSLSRGGLLALGVALIIGVFVAGRWRVHMAALAALVAIGTVAYFAAYASPQALQRVTTSNGGSGRSDIWRVGWRMFEAHPVGGVGVGNFQAVSVDYLLRPGTITSSRYIVDRPQVAHNTYLTVLAESGVVGAAAFVTLVGFALRCYQRAWRGFRRSGDRDLEVASYALFIGLVGFLAASFFLSEELSKQLWLLLAFAPALLRVSANAGTSPSAAAQNTL